MWKDPILEELYRVRAKITAESPGLKRLHARAKKLQEELRVQGVQIVNLHKAASARKNTSAVRRSRTPRKAVG